MMRLLGVVHAPVHFRAISVKEELCRKPSVCRRANTVAYKQAFTVGGGRLCIHCMKPVELSTAPPNVRAFTTFPPISNTVVSVLFEHSGPLQD